MMFLFRSMFITAISAFVMALFLFSMSTSAMPQFGRPLLHALDAVTTSSGPFEAVPTSTTASTGTDPDPDPQVIQAVSSPSASSAATTTPAAGSTSTNGASGTATTAPTAGSTSTNGASRSLCGGMSVMLGVVVSGVWLVL
ncbi:uncharacterized protein BJ212DRAFT_1490481 [Suillus subaureus]|uniref:Uncharacterized protein n=1 Tax=Suillus subaureus TaxID=48587 RepID=A0A9P7AP25_9AGAM|nr:uncharacterized protein BJ212DRAFT_1490481 [Suillus subaureus]KAG1793220.1 hypothetical protein BJ212DRAFT_1490481 [Suillus subaureus]